MVGAAAPAASPVEVVAEAVSAAAAATVVEAGGSSGYGSSWLGSSGSGSSGSSGYGSSSKASSSKAGGSKGSSGSSSSGDSRTLSSSNIGGTTNRGSGIQPSYGGGSYYAGGARVPYLSGGLSPGGISPYLLPATAGGFFGGLWAHSLYDHSMYAYPYSESYHYVDHIHHQEKSVPVVCVCQEYSECSCDSNNNSAYYDSLFNGTQPRHTSDVQVVNMNGTETIYVNGTLANGTTAAASAASTTRMPALHLSGYLVTVALVVAAVWVF